MNFQVDSLTNFCRVFILPEVWHRGYCFQGPVPCTFRMVDWFNPIPVGVPGDSHWPENYPFSISLERLHTHLVPWLRKKPYVKDGLTYLVICDFGACFTFTKQEEK